MIAKKDLFDQQMHQCKNQLSTLMYDTTHPRHIIHSLNRKLFEFMNETKESKLLRLAPNRYKFNTHTRPIASKMVVTIPQDLPLTDDERKVLSKGLNFIPVEERTNEFNLRRDLDAFYRRIHLKYHFKDQENTNGDIADPFENLQKNRSSYTPSTGENRVVDRFIDKCREEVETHLKSSTAAKHNLTKGERIAIGKLKCNENIIIKSADKGGAVVVWDKTSYITEATRQLSDATTYAKLAEDPTAANQNLVSDTVKKLIKQKELPSTAQNLINACSQTANFYMLPKIHKVGSPGRPVISSHSCPTVYIAKYLDTVLAPLVTDLPTYVKDSPDTLRILNDFKFDTPGDKFLFTMDVCSLYTSLPHDLCMEALEYYLNTRHNQSPSTTTLLRLIDLVLTTNTFQFNGEHYKQLKGIAIGAIIGPSVACLTVGYIEKNMLFDCNTVQPVLFKRYIDDILGIFVGSKEDLELFINHISNYHESLKFTSEISNVSVNFLDLKLTIQNDRISTTIHYKETDSHTYLRYDSSHPKSCKNSIPYSQLLRAKRICSEEDNFTSVQAEMTKFFHQRGYPDRITQSAIDRIQEVDRESALTKTVKPTSNRVPLVMTYHPQAISIRNIVFRNFKELQRDDTTKNIFNEPPVTAYRRDRNISNHLVRASHPSPQLPDTPDHKPGTYSCKRKRCNTCPYITQDDYTHVEGTRGSFDITCHFTCVSSNVVYAIICTRCKKIYIGETCRRLADRFTEHLRSVRNNFDGFPVARHFNLPSLCTITDMRVCGVIAARGSSNDRLTVENRLIFKLGTLQPQGLNTKFDLFTM